MMVYDVKYQLDGEERTDRVIAPHAAGAAERVIRGFRDAQGHFELLLVRLLEHPTDQSGSTSR